MARPATASMRRTSRKARSPTVEIRSVTPVRVKRMLLPTDFSRVSLRAVEFGARLARQLRAELVLLYVVDTAYGLPDAGPPSPLVRRVLEQGRKAASHQLARLRDRLADSGLTVRALMREGPAAERIVEVARKRHVDWIVMATHGRTDSERALIGSVTERVVRSAPCPVLTAARREGV